MKVYAVMCRSWNGEYDVVSVCGIYANETAANDFVKTINVHSGSYAPEFWVEEMDVIE